MYYLLIYSQHEWLWCIKIYFAAQPTSLPVVTSIFVGWFKHREYQVLQSVLPAPGLSPKALCSLKQAQHYYHNANRLQLWG